MDFVCFAIVSFDGNNTLFSRQNNLCILVMTDYPGTFRAHTRLSNNPVVLGDDRRRVARLQRDLRDVLHLRDPVAAVEGDRRRALLDHGDRPTAGSATPGRFCPAFFLHAGGRRVKASASGSLQP